MKNPCSRKMLELLVLVALKHHEISEGRAVELLGWSRHKIREQVEARVGRIDREQLIDALDIMDTKGRRNQENNSILLWSKDWDRLREILMTMLDGSDVAKVG